MVLVWIINRFAFSEASVLSARFLLFVGVAVAVAFGLIIPLLRMNRRNAAYILDYNPRAHFPVVDDKLRMRALCRRIGVPSPEIYAAISVHSRLGGLREILAGA